MQDKIINRLIEDEHVQAPVIGIGVSPFEQHHLEAFFQSFPHELNASFIVVQNHVTGDCITDLEALVLPIGYRAKTIKHGEKVMKKTIYFCPQHAAVTLTEDQTAACIRAAAGEQGMLCGLAFSVTCQCSKGRGLCDLFSKRSLCGKWLASVG